jgi:hypothetical protein
LTSSLEAGLRAQRCPQLSNLPGRLENLLDPGSESLLLSIARMHNHTKSKQSPALAADGHGAIKALQKAA